MISELKRVPVLLSCVLLLFAPLAYGCVHPWAIAILKTLILILFLVILRDAFCGRSHHLSRKPFLYIMLAFTGIVLLQLIPLPIFMIKLLSSGRWGLFFTDFSDLGIGEVPAFSNLSINSHATSAALNNLLFYMMLYISLLITISNRHIVKILSWTIIITGFIVAFLGIAQKFSGADAIYWSGLSRQMFFASFVNANHSALYLSSTAIFTFCFFFKEKNKANKMILGFFLSIMILAVLYSLSRGGILAFLVPFALLLYFIFRKSSLKGELKPLYLSAFFVFSAIVVLFLWWGTYKLLGEIGSFEGISYSGNFRLSLWLDSLGIFRKFPILGAGLGTYSYIIPSFCSFSSSVSFQFAENDYIQLLCETGMLGATATISFLFLFTRRASKVMSKPLHDIPRAKLGAIFGLLSILLNSFISFNFYIPGIMILAVFLTAFLNISGKVHR